MSPRSRTTLGASYLFRLICQIISLSHFCTTVSPFSLLGQFAHIAPAEKSAELFIQNDGSVLFQKKTVPLKGARAASIFRHDALRG